MSNQMNIVNEGRKGLATFAVVSKYSPAGYAGRLRCISRI